jgi:hypothetical protein
MIEIWNVDKYNNLDKVQIKEYQLMKEDNDRLWLYIPPLVTL